MVLAERTVEVEHQLRIDQVGAFVPVLRLVVVVGRTAFADRIARSVGIVEHHFVRPRIAVVGEDVGTQHAAQFQPVDDLHLGRQVGVHIVVAVLVVTALFEQAQRVAVGQFVVEQVFARHGIVLTVIVIGGNTHRVGDGRTVGRRLAVLVRIGEQGRYLHAFVFGGDVRTEIVTLAAVIGTFEVALLIVIACRNHIGRIGAAARYADVVVLLHGRPQNLVHVERAVAVRLEVADLFGGKGGSQPRIGFGNVEQRGVLPALNGRVEHFGLLPADHSREFDGRSLIQLALLGGDQQDAVGGARTVNGSRTGILQHRDVLDVRGIELVEAGVVRHQTVDDDQRFVVVHRTDTADVDVELVVGRVAASLLDDEAGRSALQRLRQVGDGTFGDGFGLDLVHGAHRTAAGGGAVADDDHFVHQLRVFLQRHVQQRAVGHRKRLRLVADEREVEFGIGGALDLVFTVDTGRGSDRSTFDNDGNAEQRRSCGVLHNALDGDLGCLGQGAGINGCGCKPKGGGNQQHQNRQHDFVPKIGHRYCFLV